MDAVKDALLALASCFCKRDATLKLNGRNFKIVKLLGEGGFSYVYLAQDLASGRLFALKKIRCPHGSDNVREALREVEAYKRFRHPNIIRCLDSCVVQDEQEDGKIIYLFLPYYKNATVQHVINANAVNGDKYPEKEMLTIFLGTCEAVRAMHLHPNASASSSAYPPRTSSSSLSLPSSRHPSGAGDTTEEEEDNDHDGREEGDALMLGQDSDDHSGGSRTLEQAAEDEGGEQLVMMGKMQGDPSARRGKKKEDEVAWAHRDIKPANIMLADDGVTPILMDFGSALPARIPVPDRTAALIQQDLAAEMCSMPFRAPELFDVKTGQDLTEAVDIWSLGCTLYAMAYGTSPFETAQQSDFGGSIAMAVLGGKYTFPRQDAYSQGFRDVIAGCLKVKPDERWNIDQLIERTREALARLS